MRYPLRTLVFTAALAAIATPAFGHGGGVLRLGASTAAPGGTVQIRAEGQEANGTVRLDLRSALGKYPLGDARADATGKFTISFALPAAAQPGNYNIVAIAPDGDEAGRVALVVTAPVAGNTGMDMTHMASMPGMAGMAGMEAKDEKMNVPVDTSPVEWGLIGLLSTLSFVGGAVLVRGSART